MCYDVCYGEVFSHFSTLILYSDGRLLTSRYSGVTNQVTQTRLPESEVCALLNTFDAIGLFDYDPSAYYAADQQFPRLRNGGDLQVTAWREASLNLGSVRDYVGGGLTGKVRLDATLLMADSFMTRLAKTPGEERYVPSALAVSLFTLEPGQDSFGCCFADDAGEWPLKEVLLADLAATAEPDPDDERVFRTTIDGEAARLVLDTFDGESMSLPRTYEEDGQSYVVWVRSLLPYESLSGLGYPNDKPVIPGPDVQAATVPWRCSPEDGVVDYFDELVAVARSYETSLLGLPVPTRLPIPPQPYDRKNEVDP